MSPIIIIAIVAIIAIAAFLVMRSRKNQPAATNKKSKTTAKSTKTTEAAAPAPEAKPAEKKIDINNLITQLDLLISDKEYAKAEASINLNLKQDPSLHALYLKLAEIYHAQEDDFAIKQLLDSLQKSNLNEVYQRVFNEHETFKEAQAKAQAFEQSKKAPEVFEFTPSSTQVDNSSDFDSLSNSTIEQKDNTLDFASLTTNAPTANAEEQALTFDNLNTPNAQAEVAPESPTLDFNLSTPSTETPAQETTLDFNLETPTTKTVAPVQEPSLDFKLDIPTSTETPASTTDFNFNLDTPATTPTTTNDFSFNLETPASPTLDLETPVPNNTDSLSFKLEPEPVVEETPTLGETATYADANDPIVQSFAELAVTDPVELDLDLAEQYIRLGAISAAKNLLQSHTNLSSEQAAKVDSLLQKIA